MRKLCKAEEIELHAQAGGYAQKLKCIFRHMNKSVCILQRC